MPKNKVQFQKGLSLTAFLALYGSASQCEKALVQMRWPDGLCCPACGSHSFCCLHTRRVFQCNRCKRQVSLLAGTIFQSTKLPLPLWFLAIYLLAQAKNGISALELGRQLGVNDNTAWMLKHKLLQAMQERDRGRKLKGSVQIDDGYMGGEKRGGKRGRGSENKTPLVAAVEVTGDTQQPLVLRLSLVAGFRKAELERWAREHLEPGTTVRSDGLACFQGVEDAGCQHEPTVTGGGPGSCETPGLTWVNTLMGNMKRSMDGTYHSVRPQYLARYLAEFQYRFNRRYELAAMADRLLRAAAPPRCGSIQPGWQAVGSSRGRSPHRDAPATQGNRSDCVGPRSPTLRFVWIAPSPLTARVDLPLPYCPILASSRIGMQLLGNYRVRIRLGIGKLLI